MLSMVRVEHIISFLFVIGIAQIIYIAVMLGRKKFPPTLIWKAIPPLLSIWVLFWPVYEQTLWIWFPIAILSILACLSPHLKPLFWRHIYQIWAGDAFETQSYPYPFISFIATLAISAAFFIHIPEFGFGLALTACLSFSLASLLDRIGYLQLGFPLHPRQTLLGHLSLIISSALLCSWSIHLYHGVNWQQLLIATLIAGMAASVLRAVLPRYWNLPFATLAMGWILWML